MSKRVDLTPEAYNALMQTLVATMKIAAKALDQSVALADVLMSKGVLTEAELTEALRQRARNSNTQLAMLAALDLLGGKPAD